MSLSSSSPAVLPEPKQFVRLRAHGAPRLGENMLGTVVAHPRHPSGTEVVTSPVLHIEGSRVRTRYSEYELVGLN